jgi:predicted RNase H-like HicB family nuclease
VSGRTPKKPVRGAFFDICISGRLAMGVSGHATVGSMKYPVALVPSEGGYSASCPGLPGCWSQGATEEEALANIQDAIAEYLEVAKQLAGPQNLREVEVPA